jgi:hypothetical protein
MMSRVLRRALLWRYRPEECDCNPSVLCMDCEVEVWPWEMYMVIDAIWRQVGEPSALCVGCLEERLGRRLVPADFPELPINDDEEHDSFRLRERKGSGRDSMERYMRGVVMVLDGGRDVEAVAAELDVSAHLLLHGFVAATRIGREVEAEIEREEAKHGR